MGKGKRGPNYPSKTGRPSGKGRGNTPKGKGKNQEKPKMEETTQKINKKFLKTEEKQEKQRLLRLDTGFGGRRENL